MLRVAYAPASAYHFDESWGGRLRTIKEKIFNASDLALLLGVILPTLFFHMGLTTYRLAHSYQELNSSLILQALFSDIFFHMTLFSVAVGLYGFLRFSSLKVIFFVFVQLVAIFLNVVEISAHDYYMSTGALLDYRLMAYSLENYAEISKVVSSKVTLGTQILYGLGVGGAIVFPTVIYLLFRKKRPARKNTKNAVLRIGFIFFGIFSYFIMTLPNKASDGKLFDENLTYQFLQSWIDEHSAASEMGESHEMPVSTILKPKSHAKKNVVFIIMESVNAKATSLYGSHWKTTPFLKKFAEKSLLVQRAYTVTPHTSKALVAIHCGYEGRPYMKIVEAETGGLPQKCLPRLLKEQGYASAFFQSPTGAFENRGGLVKNMGFSRFYPMEKLPRKDHEPVNFLGWEDDIMLKPTEKWLDKFSKKKKKNFILTFLTNTTHWEYNVPESFKKKRYTKRNDFNDYLNTVRYVDDFIRKLISIFKEKGYYKNTIFVILGDHGEGFYEHGLSFHNRVLYEEGIRIPMLIHVPGKFTRGFSAPQVVSQVDLLPTVVDFAGFKIRKGRYNGRHILKPRKKRLVYTNCWQDRQCIALTGKRYKYMYHFRRQKEELYDLKRDPLEKNNIADQSTLLPTLREMALSHYFNLEKSYQTTSGIQGLSDRTFQ